MNCPESHYFDKTESTLDSQCIFDSGGQLVMTETPLSIWLNWLIHLSGSHQGGTLFFRHRHSWHMRYLPNPSRLFGATFLRNLELSWDTFKRSCWGWVWQGTSWSEWTCLQDWKFVQQRKDFLRLQTGVVIETRGFTWNRSSGHPLGTAARQWRRGPHLQLGRQSPGGPGVTGRSSRGAGYSPPRCPVFHRGGWHKLNAD